MDKVLIVDDNVESVENLREGLQKLNQFQVITAYDGEEAIGILEQERISLLVTDIKMPKVDGLELLAYMTEKHAATPCIVMTGYGTPEMRQLIDTRGVLQYIEKPFDFRKLALAIIEGLHLLDEGASMKGMTLRTFLPLVGMAQKSCRLEVTSSGKGKGYFYFDQGELREAHYKSMRGDPAAQEMLSWETMEIRFNALPQGRARGRISKSLAALLAESQGTPTRASGRDADSDASVSEFTMQPDLMRPEARGSRTQPLAASRRGDDPLVVDQQTYEQAFRSHVDKLRSAKGYQGAAILNFAGEVAASDTLGDEFPIREWCARFTELFRTAHEAAVEEGLGECRELTLHTESRVGLICSSGLASKVRFYLVGFAVPDGNWYYLKMEIDKAVVRIHEDIAAAL